MPEHVAEPPRKRKGYAAAVRNETAVVAVVAAVAVVAVVADAGAEATRTRGENTGADAKKRGFASGALRGRTRKSPLSGICPE